MIRRLAVLTVTLAALAVAPVFAAPLHPFGQGSWSELLKAHSGKPLVVHFWGVTCAPCMVEMPKWAALARDDLGFDLVLIDADPIEGAPEDGGPMLAKMGLGDAESWRFADGFVERLRFEVDPKWRGELPYTVLIDPDGRKRAVYGSVDFAEVKRWLEAQLDRKKH